MSKNSSMIPNTKMLNLVGRTEHNFSQKLNKFILFKFKSLKNEPF